MTQLQAGALRTRARIQRRTTEKGARGQSTDHWQDIGAASCDVEYLSGRKLELARQLWAQTTVSIKMRRPRAYTLTARDRMIVDGQTFTLGAIVPKADGRDDIEILCEVQQ